jgi:hypothetical protein
MEIQGCNAAPSLDVLILMQQVFTASVSNQRSDQAFRYAYCQHHPLLQPEFLPLKLADWIAKNLAEKLNLPDPGHEWSSGDLTRILTRCLVSDRRGNNLHTFHTVEFESDLYHRVMRARCYPFNMAQHRFHGKNVKVCQLHLH